MKVTAKDRVLARVVVVDQCWVYGGPLSTGGYARFKLNGRNVSVHRFMYEAECGPIPDGLVIDHLCKNRACCNPAHLEPVTQQENLMRSPTLQAVNAAKVACPSGHPYDEINTYRDPSGRRQCRECRSRRQRSRSRKEHAR